MPAGLDPAAHVRRAQARPRRGRAHPRARPRRIVRREGRVSSAGTLAGAVRARSTPGSDRAAEAGALGRGCVRRVAQASAAALPAPDRARHGQRRRRPPGRDHDDPDPLPAGPCPCRRNARPGPACRRRDRRGARSGQPRARDRRRHPHPRRWQLRRPAPVQRRERRSRRRGLPGTDRLGRRARAGHAAVRPRCGRPRVDPHGGGQARRPRSRGAPCRADARPRLARTLRSALDRAGA